jgi:putative endonuclease
MAWTVYLLECADGALYCGITTDLARRLRQHNGEAPGGAACTRGRRPVRLAASLELPDRAAACRVEWAVKRQRPEAKLAYLKSLRPAGEA